MKKAGAGHIEVIISLILFVGFILLAFYFFSPIDTSRTLKSSLTYAFRELSANFSTSLESYSIRINTDDPQPEIIGVTLAQSSAKKIRVENYLGDVLPSYHQGNNIYFNRMRSGTLYDFAIVRLNEDFVEPQSLDPTSLPAINNATYSVSSSESRTVLSEKRIRELASSYSSSQSKYNSLKTDFNLPNRVDFSFNVQFSPGDEVDAQIPIQENLEVFSDRQKVEVIRQSGESAFAYLTIKVW